MLLKSETALNIYQHRDKTILCRVQPKTDVNNREMQTTCRSLTSDQWNIFDKELRSWLDNNDCDLNEESCTLKVTPNLEVKIQKSKLSAKHFYKCARNGEYLELLDDQTNLHVFDCRLECKPSVCKLPPTPSMPIDEYEPIPTTGKNNDSLSPLSYEPYTPSKRVRQHSCVDNIKTPGIDLLEFVSTDDAYSPQPIPSTVDTADDILCTNGTQPVIPQYKPAPIKNKRLSQDSLQSNVNEFIPETDDELTKSATHRTRRTKLKTKCNSQRDYGEYVPDAQMTADDIPAYKPTPIVDDVKQETPKVPKEKDDQHAQVPKLQKQKQKTDTCVEDKKSKSKKEKSKESVQSSEKKRSSYTSAISEDEFEDGSNKRKDRDSKKVDYDHDADKGSSKQRDKEHKGKRRVQITENSDQKETERNERPIADRKIQNFKVNSRPQSPPIRRSERSPSKPRRYIEEQENYTRLKKEKSLKTSPTNNELFGTDDDDDGISQSDSNNNANNEASQCYTPKPNKKKSSTLLSSSSSSSTKKKRKRYDCEQEKADLSKWLGKKPSNSGESKTIESSKEKSSLPAKTPKKIKSCKDNKPIRNKSPSPKYMDIIMPSKEELEQIRNKNRLQREENEKFKSALEKVHVPPPKQVENLSLKDMSLNELLDTFTTYKPDLDKIYEKNRKKDYVKGSDGINHCLVIGLTDQAIQLKMMEKLSDVYHNTNSTTQATLYANALLPEWIIRVFMEKHKFSRLEAISQIEDQEAYKSYTEGQNENSLLFDDD